MREVAQGLLWRLTALGMPEQLWTAPSRSRTSPLQPRHLRSARRMLRLSPPAASPAQRSAALQSPPPPQVPMLQTGRAGRLWRAGSGGCSHPHPLPSAPPLPQPSSQTRRTPSAAAPAAAAAAARCCCCSALLRCRSLRTRRWARRSPGGTGCRHRPALPPTLRCHAPRSKQWWSPCLLVMHTVQVAGQHGPPQPRRPSPQGRLRVWHPQHPQQQARQCALLLLWWLLLMHCLQVALRPEACRGAH